MDHSEIFIFSGKDERFKVLKVVIVTTNYHVLHASKIKYIQDIGRKPKTTRKDSMKPRKSVWCFTYFILYPNTDAGLLILSFIVVSDGMSWFISRPTFDSKILTLYTGYKCILD